MGNAKQYRVRRGYVVRLGNKLYKAGQIVSMTEEEYQLQSWKVEPVKKQAKAPENTAMKESEVKNK